MPEYLPSKNDRVLIEKVAGRYAIWAIAQAVAAATISRPWLMAEKAYHLPVKLFRLLAAHVPLAYFLPVG
ncbi:MAG: hypothetical protein AAF564_04475 [Bacteroidota bacterium]